MQARRRHRPDRAERGANRREDRYWERSNWLLPIRVQAKRSRNIEYYLWRERQRKWHRLTATNRQRRLCARSGHVWGHWLSFMQGSVWNHNGAVESETLRGQARYCRRCHEQQYRTLFFNGASEAV